jgi:hypothetical protein
MMESGVLPYALHVEAEVHDVAVLHHIVFALDGQFAGFADSGLGAILQVVGILDDLGADKAQSTSVTRPIISLFIRLPRRMKQAVVPVAMAMLSTTVHILSFVLRQYSHRARIRPAVPPWLASPA